MTGETNTERGAPDGHPALPVRISAARAAHELGLRQNEFDLAVRLGLVRTVPEPGQGPEPPGTAAARRVTRAEIDRLRAAEGFPETLRCEVRTVSGPQAARELGISPERFTRLARLGLVTPVAFYVNRYRAVVWLYRAAELHEFAAVTGNRRLLTERLPETVRAQLESGIDWRARNWRGRHAGCLLRLTDDPWARAAVTASLLAPDEVADAVPDPAERAYLTWLRPAKPHQSPPGSTAAEVADALLTADDPHEIGWLRASLALALAAARKQRAAPGATPAPPPSGPPDRDAPGGGPLRSWWPGRGADKPTGRAGTGPPGRPRRLWGRLRRTCR